MTLNDLDLNDLNDLNAPASSAESRSSMKTKAGLKWWQALVLNDGRRQPSMKTYRPSRIFLMSLSLFNASTGVRLLISRPRISSRIWLNTGSSNWKKLS